MDFSFYTVESNFTRGVGYSEAVYGMNKAIKKMGHKLLFNDDTPRCQINFCQPSYFVDTLSPHQYNIAYVPWESTEIPEDWHEIFDMCDEVWTTSEWVKQIYEDLGHKVVEVWHHGIDESWYARKRIVKDKIRFLHHGEPAVRKGGQLAFDAFRAAFDRKDDVELIIKANEYSTVREQQPFFGPPTGNVRIISDFMSHEDLVGLYQRVNCVVYPTYGEGFGFIPLQALSTGIPSITTAECAPYSEYLGNLGISSRYIDSPWSHIHPGKMLEPDFDDLVDKYRFVYENAEKLMHKYYAQSYDVQHDFSWSEVTKPVINNLITRLDTI